MGIVVDPEFGERLTALAARLHVWAADTWQNRVVAERLWATNPGYDAERGVTLFHVDPAERPDAWAAHIVGTVAEHHGEYSHDPPLSALEIYGASSSARLQAALAEFGFTEIRAADVALLASMPPAA